MFIVYLYCAASGERSAATSQVHPGVLRIINAGVNSGFPLFKLELLVFVSSKCRTSFSV